jgi:hypothetical protein
MLFMSQPTSRATAPPRPANPHAESLRISTELSSYYVENIVTPWQVIALLNREKISFVLVGAHGVGGWMGDPRATQDVDVVVAERHIKKATRVLLAEFPHLEARDEEVVVRLQDRESEKVLIDLLKPRALYRETFKHTHAVSVRGHNYRIPSLEMALAMKFAAMISPARPLPKRLKDASDFALMVGQNPDLDEGTLHRLAELVYRAGGVEVREIVQKVRAGEQFVFRIPGAGITGRYVTAAAPPGGRRPR